MRLGQARSMRPANLGGPTIDLFRLHSAASLAAHHRSMFESVAGESANNPDVLRFGMAIQNEIAVVTEQLVHMNLESKNSYRRLRLAVGVIAKDSDHPGPCFSDNRSACLRKGSTFPPRDDVSVGPVKRSPRLDGYGSCISAFHIRALCRHFSVAHCKNVNAAEVPWLTVAHLAINP